MAAYTLALDIVTDIESIGALAASLYDEFAEIFRGDQQTPLQVRSLRASFVGLIEEVRVLRRRLDPTLITDLLVDASDEGRVIQISRWERDQRGLLTEMTFRAQESVRALESLEQGPERRIVISKSNETLQIIALRELGSFDDWDKLLEANPDLAPGTLPSGTVIIIPERR